jgi:hypothetical protein
VSAPTIAAWHDILASRDLGALRALLAEDACFHSPVVHTPQRGQALTALYLAAAVRVFEGSGFHYVREVAAGNDAVLEFMAEIDGITINGVDMIHWNAHGQIDDFKVMIRPWKGIEKLREKMAAMLQQLQHGEGTTTDGTTRARL